MIREDHAAAAHNRSQSRRLVGKGVLALNFRTYFFHPERAPGVTPKAHAFRTREHAHWRNLPHGVIRSCMGCSEKWPGSGLSGHLVALSLPAFLMSQLALFLLASDAQ